MTVTAADSYAAPSEPVVRLLDKLDGIRRSGAGWMARCPAHDDQTASLAVANGDDGRCLAHCHAGCSLEAVLAAVQLAPADLFAQPRPETLPRARRRIVATYDYADAAGGLAYQVVRYAPKDFRQRRPDGDGWTWSLNGVERVPYRLPELLAAPADTTVYIPEGERDVDALIAAGAVATCNAGGAGKWPATFAPHLAGRRVVILPDNDEPGRVHAEQVRVSLGEVATVHVLELPGLPDKGDVSDWLEAGGSVEQLAELAVGAPPLSETPKSRIPYRTPMQIAASTAEQPDWLVRGFVALGAVTEVDGKVKSSGKTTFVTHLVAAVLDGVLFLGMPTMKTKVVYISEQPPGSFREALARAGLLTRGDELRIVLRGDVVGMGWSDLIAIATADAIRDGYGLIVVDTFGKLAGLQDENDAGATGKAMIPLQNAAHAGLAVIVCRHDRKGGGEVGESGRGSSAISGDVDVILALRRPEGKQPANRRVIETLSRYAETPEKVVIELTDEGYVLLGPAEAVALHDGLRIVSALIGGENEQKESWTVDELVTESGLTRATTQRALHELRYRGDVIESGKGRRGDPIRYAASKTVSAHTHGLLGQKETKSPKLDPDSVEGRYQLSIEGEEL